MCGTTIVQRQALPGRRGCCHADRLLELIEGLLGELQGRQAINVPSCEAVFIRSRSVSRLKLVFEFGTVKLAGSGTHLNTYII